MKRKKIFYVPGMISLIFIPVFCLFYFYKNDSFSVYSGLNISFVDDKSFIEYKVPVLRKYKDFTFCKSKLGEKNKLNDLQIFLRKLVKNSDTINGVKVHFGSKTDYDVFVSVIDILNVENVPTWAPYKDDIYILGSSNKPKRNKNKKIEHRMNCGTSELMRKENLRMQDIEREEEELQFQISFFKKQWTLFLAYLGIVLLNVYVLIKFNKNRNHNQKSYI